MSGRIADRLLPNPISNTQSLELSARKKAPQRALKTTEEAPLAAGLKHRVSKAPRFGLVKANERAALLAEVKRLAAAIDPAEVLAKCTRLGSGSFGAVYQLDELGYPDFVMKHVGDPSASLVQSLGASSPVFSLENLRAIGQRQVDVHNLLFEAHQPFSPVAAVGGDTRFLVFKKAAGLRFEDLRKRGLEDAAKAEGEKLETQIEPLLTQAGFTSGDTLQGNARFRMKSGKPVLVEAYDPII